MSGPERSRTLASGPPRRARHSPPSSALDWEPAGAGEGVGSNGTQPMPPNQTSTQEWASRSRTSYCLVARSKSPARSRWPRAPGCRSCAASAPSRPRTAGSSRPCPRTGTTPAGSAARARSRCTVRRAGGSARSCGPRRRSSAVRPPACAPGVDAAVRRSRRGWQRRAAARPAREARTGRRCLDVAGAGAARRAPPIPDCPAAAGRTDVLAHDSAQRVGRGAHLLRARVGHVGADRVGVALLAAARRPAARCRRRRLVTPIVAARCRRSCPRRSAARSELAHGDGDPPLPARLRSVRDLGAERPPLTVLECDPAQAVEAVECLGLPVVRLLGPDRQQRAARCAASRSARSGGPSRSRAALRSPPIAQLAVVDPRLVASSAAASGIATRPASDQRRRAGQRPAAAAGGAATATRRSARAAGRRGRARRRSPGR